LGIGPHSSIYYISDGARDILLQVASIDVTFELSADTIPAVTMTVQILQALTAESARIHSSLREK